MEVANEHNSLYVDNFELNEINEEIITLSTQ